MFILIAQSEEANRKEAPSAGDDPKLSAAGVGFADTHTIG
jgi:hypothetical protein